MILFLSEILLLMIIGGYYFVIGLSGFDSLRSPFRFIFLVIFCVPNFQCQNLLIALP